LEQILFHKMHQFQTTYLKHQKFSYKMKKL
jgi:hypothetical protein